jgi:hypothetical protein
MKTTFFIYSILCAYSVTVSAQTTSPTCTPFYTDNFSNANGWTTVDPQDGNGSIKITGGAITFSNADTTPCNTNHGACNGREIRLYRPLNPALSNTSWRAECKFNITDGNGPGHTLMGFTAGNNEPQGTYTGCSPWVCGGGNSCTGSFTAANQDGIFASLIAFGNNQLPSTDSDQLFNPTNQTYDTTHPSSTNNPPNLGWRIFGHAKHNAGGFYQTPIVAASNTNAPPLDTSRGIELPALKTDYYLRLERLNADECMISVFSDPAMQNHVKGSPQCFLIEKEIQNLNTIQNFTLQSGSYYRSLTGTVDDVKIYNQCPDTPASCINPGACGTITEPNATCDHGVFTYTFTVTNNTNQQIEWLLFSTPAGATYGISPPYIHLGTPLPPGGHTTASVTITNASPGDHICLNVALADKDVVSCCTIQTCFDLCPCLKITDAKAVCARGPNGYTFTATIQNLTGVAVQQLFVVPISPANINVTLSPTTMPIPFPGGTTVTGTITGAGAQPGAQVCLRFVPFGTEAQCCSTKLCFVDPLPPCRPPPPPDQPQTKKPKK